MQKIILEICANSLYSALEAQSGGADRIELCENLELGGVTPSAGTLKMCREKLHIPIHVLIRPRGGDFLYSDHEFEVMKQDVIFCKEIGMDGVVIGILLPDGNIDKERCEILKMLAMPMSLTFHRAFDFCKDPLLALEDIITLGFNRILTAGQQNTVPEGIELIAQLIKKADNRIIIMPGSGINEDNVLEIITKTGAREIHATARTFKDGHMKFRKDSVNLSLSLNADGYGRISTDKTKVEMLCRLIRNK